MATRWTMLREYVLGTDPWSINPKPTLDGRGRGGLRDLFTRQAVVAMRGSRVSTRCSRRSRCRPSRSAVAGLNRGQQPQRDLVMVPFDGCATGSRRSAGEGVPASRPATVWRPRTRRARPRLAGEGGAGVMFKDRQITSLRVRPSSARRPKACGRFRSGGSALRAVRDSTGCRRSLWSGRLLARGGFFGVREHAEERLAALLHHHRRVPHARERRLEVGGQRADPLGVAVVEVGFEHQQALAGRLGRAGRREPGLRPAARWGGRRACGSRSRRRCGARSPSAAQRACIPRSAGQRRSRPARRVETALTGHAGEQLAAGADWASRRGRSEGCRRCGQRAAGHAAGAELLEREGRRSTMSATESQAPTMKVNGVGRFPGRLGL